MCSIKWCIYLCIYTGSLKQKLSHTCRYKTILQSNLFFLRKRMHKKFKLHAVLRFVCLFLLVFSVICFKPRVFDYCYRLFTYKKEVFSCRRMIGYIMSYGRFERHFKRRQQCSTKRFCAFFSMRHKFIRV